MAADPPGPSAAILRLIGDAPGKPRRWFGRHAGRLVMVQAWDAGGPPPAARSGGAVGEAKPALVALVSGAGGPVLRKALLAAAARLGHRPGTAAKALAELVRDGELLNPRDWLGYRLPGWGPARPGPGLFDHLGG
jgi:hypothetical protein